ncbi:MAG: AraC family transcriptional regulator [Lewinellaceae bacterium]|nr:AraC family transcriptional regulator [Lewinellaceae bacterium]HPR01392.1 AraC family transcriptional regulator [Saprospiraceae bacterium]
MASASGLPSHVLSQLINRQGGKNIFDFINNYRVEAVKLRIRNKAHSEKTLLSIALECGFNSKASFNRVFLKMSGQTPRDYGRSLE